MAETSFNKIFKALAKDEDMDCPVEEVQIGILYNNGVHKFVAYKENKETKKFVSVKDIDLDEYASPIGVDLTGGTSVVETTIAQAGPKYAKDYGCSVDEIRILMRHRDGDLPLAVLLKNNEKIRMINIEQEFIG